MRLLENTALWLLLITLGASGCGWSSDYKGAVRNTIRGGNYADKIDFDSCVRNWSFFEGKRVRGKFIRAMSEGQNNYGVLLEIGGSGFPRYDYVIINKFSLESNLGEPQDLVNSELGRLLQDIYDKDLVSIDRGSSRAVDDGPCYYMTLVAGKVRKELAFYGEPENSLEGSLVRKILAVADK